MGSSTSSPSSFLLPQRRKDFHSLFSQGQSLRSLLRHWTHKWTHLTNSGQRSVAFTTLKKIKPNQLQGYWPMGAEAWGGISSPQSRKQQQLTPELSPGEDGFCQYSLPQVSRLRALRKESFLQLLKKSSIFSLCSYWNRVLFSLSLTGWS